VFFDQDVAKCAIQQEFQEGRFHWPKPLSCHLFPVRVRGKQRDQLRFETFSECSPAFVAGRAEGVSLVDFLEEPLTRAFGEEFYSGLRRHRDDVLSGNGDAHGDTG
jgi:hypothetical protein